MASGPGAETDGPRIPVAGGYRPPIRDGFGWASRGHGTAHSGSHKTAIGRPPTSRNRSLKIPRSRRRRIPVPHRQPLRSSPRDLPPPGRPPLDLLASHPSPASLSPRRRPRTRHPTPCEAATGDGGGSSTQVRAHARPPLNLTSGRWRPRGRASGDPTVALALEDGAGRARCRGHEDGRGFRALEKLANTVRRALRRGRAHLPTSPRLLLPAFGLPVAAGAPIPSAWVPPRRIGVAEPQPWAIVSANGHRRASLMTRHRPLAILLLLTLGASEPACSSGPGVSGCRRRR